MIVVFGTVCLDRIRHIPNLPDLGAYVEIESEAILLGGEAANTASHLRRWGADSTLLGNSLGADPEGALISDLLLARGITYETQGAPGEMTPVCDVYVTPDGERTMFGLGFKSMVAPDPCSLVSSPGGWFTVDANLGDVGETVAARARTQGMRLYLMDLAPTCDLLGPGVHWQSSTRWVGERGNPGTNSDFVQGVVDLTGCTAILTDSARGFYLASPHQPVRAYPPFPRILTRDSTGAGDTFRAGMLLGLDQMWAESQCLCFASAAAALAAGFVGAAEGPTRSEVEAHIAAYSEVANQYA